MRSSVMIPLIATALLPLAIGAAQAGETARAGWYIGADGGVNILENEKLSGTDPDGSTFTDKGRSKVGYALQAQGGYDFGGPKVELELGYRASTLKSLAEMDGKASGDTSSLSFMTNGLYQFLPQSSWHPFVGAGVGLARIGAHWRRDREKIVNDSNWVFAYQGFGGVAYDIDKNWGIKTQYRYFATQDAALKTTDGGKFDIGYHSHDVLAGITYKFGK